MLTHHTTGNFELDTTISGRAASPSAKITFAGDDPAAQVYLTLDATGFKEIRESGGERTVLRDCPGIGVPPWRIRVLKKGSSFRFWANHTTGWVRGPLGEWEHTYEPSDARISVEVSEGCAVESCTITTLPWLQAVTEPVIHKGPAGSHYEDQIIPGTIAGSATMGVLSQEPGATGAGYQRRAVRQHLDRLAADGGQRWHRLRILHRQSPSRPAKDPDRPVD